MSVLCQLVQCIKNPTAQTDKFSFLNTHFLCNGICCLKSNPPDIICQAVWIFFHDCNTLTSICLENLCRMRSADFMTLEEQHNILNFFLLLPAGLDPVYPDFPDTGYF